MSSSSTGMAVPPPTLYSLRNCPFAIRARLGLWLANQSVAIREVQLKDKPADFLALSSKATVPVLVVSQGLPTGEGGMAPAPLVIEESVEIMLWALGQNDPHKVLYPDDGQALTQMLQLIEYNDDFFIDWLEKYKKAVRYRDAIALEYRQQGEIFIAQLEQRLAAQRYFIGDTVSLADYAIFPFIRQFAQVERHWYLQAPYPLLRQWLNEHLQSALFTKIMGRYR